MKRDPSKPKASDIPLPDILAAVDHYAGGGPWIVDALELYPAKVTIARLHKLVSQGLVQEYSVGAHRRYCLTPKGREALAS